MRYLLTLLLLFFCFFSGISLAQSEPKIVLHLNDTDKLPHLENSINNIKKELGQDVDIHVVVNGKAVASMIKGNRLVTGVIKNIIEENVPIGLCHNAVRNNKVNPDHLIKGLTVLPDDGNVTIINLQKKGYRYIKL